LNGDSFVDEAFTSDEQRISYLESLRNSDEEFGSANSLEMTQGTTNGVAGVQAPATDGGERSVTSGIPFIVVVSVCGAILVGLVGLFVYSRRRRRKSRGYKRSNTPPPRTQKRPSPPPAPAASGQDKTSSPQETYPMDTSYEEEDDSLYDLDLEVPTRFNRSTDTGSIFTNGSSVTMDYDDQVAFSQKQSLYASTETGAPPGGGGVTESYARRPSAGYYRYTVEAPPGLLGMVLESSADGTPSVYGIRNSSPLASDVEVGDRLMTVDGLDVSEMDATAVSRLIASKKENKYRQLTFVRPTDEDQEPVVDYEDLE